MKTKIIIFVIYKLGKYMVFIQENKFSLKISKKEINSIIIVRTYSIEKYSEYMLNMTKN